MTPFIAYDDGRGVLSPLNDLRATFDIRTGAVTTLERIQSLLGGFAIGLFVPESLAALTRERHAAPVNETPPHAAMVVNGRCPLPPPSVNFLRLGEAIVEEGSGDLVAAHLAPQDAAALLKGETPRYTITETLAAPALMSRPGHVRTFRDACLDVDLGAHSGAPAREMPKGAVCFGQHKLWISPSAKVYPGATIDLENGPVAIEDHAVVRPGAILIGPCSVGPHSTVLERATIRPHTAIGPWCKVNGEVGGVIFQGFANKAHDGYLGDSFVGEWVNLGAGTTISNLLNTYGEVIARASVSTGNERSGQQFLGPIIGDHVKTAICTRLMTGSVIHTGAMIASTAAASGCVPRFAWITDSGQRTYRPEKFAEVMRAAMARRKVEPSAAYSARIAALHTGA